MRRLERPTSTSRTWRASQLCYIPYFFRLQRYKDFTTCKIFFSFPIIKNSCSRINPALTSRNKWPLSAITSRFSQQYPTSFSSSREAVLSQRDFSFLEDAAFLPVIQTTWTICMLTVQVSAWHPRACMDAISAIEKRNTKATHRNLIKIQKLLLTDMDGRTGINTKALYLPSFL